MTVQLMRKVLREPYAAAGDAHPGLLIQRGYEEFDNQTEAGKERKTKHIARICAISASPFYHRAFQRWRGFTMEKGRFLGLELDLETRLFIGLTGGGALETGCAISHSYGMPYIPGSGVKGIVTAYVRGTVFRAQHQKLCDALFGSEPNDDNPDGLAGAITFHDAWWVPGSADSPLVQEVVTTHHLEYYGSEGKTPATDLDSPIPNAQIAVRGRFLFMLEGPAAAWLSLAAEMLATALGNHGVGAKTRSGYGFFRAPEGGGTGGSSARCPWVDDTVARLMKQNRAPEDDTVRGKGLAAEWQAISDPDLKAQALADIQQRWEKKGWWADPPSKSAQQVKGLYGAS